MEEARYFLPGNLFIVFDKAKKTISCKHNFFVLNSDALRMYAELKYQCSQRI